MAQRLKTIMHLISTNFYGGPEKQIIGHLSRLKNMHYNGILVSFVENGSPNETLDYAKSVGLKNFGIYSAGLFDFRVFWNLGKILRQEKVELLCTHGYKSTVMGWWIGKKANIPVLAFSRGYTTENLKVAFYEWLERQTLGKVAGIIFVSKSQKQRLESYKVQIKRGWIVQNAVSVKQMFLDNLISDSRKDICKRFDIPENAQIVVSAGRMSPEKGHRFLVEAIGIISKKKKGAYFIFCGDGVCLENLKRQAQNLGVIGQCRFPGFSRDLPKIFNVMDLMVLPSLTEGLPNVVLEALACAKPVVASNVGGVPEIIENTVSGVLVPPAQPDLLAKAISKCLAKPDMMRAMGKAGSHKVKSKFTFDSQTQKLEEIYHNVLREWQK